MMNSTFQHQWGVWFCFVGEPGDSYERYNENYMQVYSIRTPADLALLWKDSHLNNLDQFLLQSNSKQLA